MPTWWNSAARTSRPKPIAVRAPKYTAMIVQTICRTVTASMIPPVDMMKPVSPLATPSSMISAFSAGRYSEAMVPISWKMTTAVSGPR